MIASLLTILLAFIWLLYETDYMRVRLAVGSICVKPKAKGKWQFARFGGDCIMMRDRCYMGHCQLCKQGGRFFAWRIPARSIKLDGSTINFKAGCNLYRANLLKAIVKAQKSTAMPHYKPLPQRNYDYEWLYGIELLVDGKPVLATGNGNSDYKRGMIKEALKRYHVCVGKTKVWLTKEDEAILATWK